MNESIAILISLVPGNMWYWVLPFGLLLIVKVLGAIVRSPWFKGIAGEFQVNALIKIFLPKGKYHLIKNVTLPTEDGTTQIDHIIVSRFGIFVLETKNMAGWIFGEEHQKQWTQKIFRKSYKFQNPIHQNYKHLKTLSLCLNIDEQYLFSVIVFIGGSSFKTHLPPSVTHARGCISYIQAKNDILLSDEQVFEIVSAIDNERFKRGFKTNRKHVAHVKKIVKSKNDEKNCPKCGSSMSIREAKKGQKAGSKFWVCTSFPKCRGIIKIT